MVIKSSDVVRKLEETALEMDEQVNQNLLNVLNGIPDNLEFNFFEDTEAWLERLSLMNNDFHCYSDSLIVSYFIDGLVKAKNTDCLLYKKLKNFFDNSGNNFLEKNKEK